PADGQREKKAHAAVDRITKNDHRFAPAQAIAPPARAELDEIGSSVGRAFYDRKHGGQISKIRNCGSTEGTVSQQRSAGRLVKPVPHTVRLSQPCAGASSLASFFMHCSRRFRNQMNEESRNAGISRACNFFSSCFPAFLIGVSYLPPAVSNLRRCGGSCCAYLLYGNRRDQVAELC